jgi:hypothetical protein
MGKSCLVKDLTNCGAGGDGPVAFHLREFVAVSLRVHQELHEGSPAGAGVHQQGADVHLAVGPLAKQRRLGRVPLPEGGHLKLGGIEIENVLGRIGENRVDKGQRHGHRGRVAAAQSIAVGP